MIFLLSNMVETSLISTGAFEIYLGDEQIWSKIDSGRVPSPGELLQMVDQQLAILGKIPSTTGFNEGFDQVAWSSRPAQCVNPLLLLLSRPTPKIILW